MKYLYILILCILFCQPWTGQGASYTGRNAADATAYLDNSQGKRGFGFSNPGHPRNHVSANQPPSVEHYSLKQPKSGFDTRGIQDEIAHRVLINPKVQAAMNILNQYDQKTKKSKKYIRQDVNLSNHDLNLPNQTLTGGKWLHGKRTNRFNINGAVIVLQHFNGKENDRSAPVHILTFYPN